MIYSSADDVLKCPYYAFSDITFQAVCHVAVYGYINFQQSCEADSAR